MHKLIKSRQNFAVPTPSFMQLGDHLCNNSSVDSCYQNYQIFSQASKYFYLMNRYIILVVNADDFFDKFMDGVPEKQSVILVVELSQAINTSFTKIFDQIITIKCDASVVLLHQNDLSTSTNTQHRVSCTTIRDQFISAKGINGHNSLGVRVQQLPDWVNRWKISPRGHRNGLHHQMASKKMRDHLR